MSNSFCGTGNLGKAPELKYIPDDKNGGQKAVANFSIRFDRDKPVTVNGQTQYVDNGGFWLDSSIFGAAAERVVKLLNKGCRVYAEGSLKQEVWGDENENSKLKFVASYIAVDLIGVESITFQPRKNAQKSSQDNAMPTQGDQDLPPLDAYQQDLGTTDTTAHG